MYRAMPEVKERAEELKQAMKQERHPLKRQRLQMLYLVASEQATTRSALAPLLGVHRETVGDWLAAYAEGGLDALLTIRTPPGKTPFLPPDVVEALRAKLSQPEGVARYRDVQVWLVEQFGLDIKYKTLANFLRTKLNTSPKVVRPQHIKKRRSPATVQRHD